MTSLSLAGLAQLLRADYPLGVEEALRVQHLDERLAEARIAITDAETAARYLAPVICRDGAAQAGLAQTIRSRLDQPAPEQDGPSALADAVAQSRTDRWMKRLAPLIVPLIVLCLVAGVIVLCVLIARQGAATAPGAQAGNVAPQTISNDYPIRWTQITMLKVAAAAAPLFACAAVIARRRRRRRVLTRGRAPDGSPLAPLSISLPQIPLFDVRAIRGALRDLRRHTWRPSEQIDVRASLTATVRRMGFATLVCRYRAVTPEHLFLIDRVTRDDHLGEAAELLARRLLAEGVKVDRYDFRGDPSWLRVVSDQTAPPEGGRPRTETLENLRVSRAGCRVIVFADIAGFWDARRGDWRSWVYHLAAFKTATVITPTPQSEWGERERQLVKLGVRVSTATSEGLTDLGRTLRDGRRGVLPNLAVSASSALDRRLAAEPYLWTGETPPEAVEIEALVADLRTALTPAAFDHLCAIALFPQIEPRLSAWLGRRLAPEGTETVFEAQYAAIARLPWLRQGRMPDWLRLALAQDLGRRPEAAERVRGVWAAILAERLEKGDETLTLDVTPITGADARRVIAGLVRPPRAPNLRETILLKFLDGEDLSDLTLDAPGKLAEALPEPDAPSVAEVLIAAAAGATAVLGILAAGPFLRWAGSQDVALLTTVRDIAPPVLSVAGFSLWLARSKLTVLHIVPAWIAVTFSATSLALAVVLELAARAPTVTPIIAALGALVWSLAAPSSLQQQLRHSPITSLFMRDRWWETSLFVAIGAIIVYCGLALLFFNGLNFAFSNISPIDMPLECGGYIVYIIGTTIYLYKIKDRLKLYWIEAIQLCLNCAFSVAIFKQLIPIINYIYKLNDNTPYMLFTCAPVMLSFVIVFLDRKFLISKKTLYLAILCTILSVTSDIAWSLAGLGSAGCLVLGQSSLLQWLSIVFVINRPVNIQKLIKISVLIGTPIFASLYILFGGESSSPIGSAAIIVATLWPMISLWPGVRWLYPELWNNPAVSQSSGRSITTRTRAGIADASYGLPIALLSSFSLDRHEDLSIALYPLAAWIALRLGWRRARTLILWSAAPLLIGFGPLWGAPLPVVGGVSLMSHGNIGRYLALLLLARLVADAPWRAGWIEARRLTWGQVGLLLGPLAIAFQVFADTGQLGRFVVDWDPAELLGLALILVGASRIALARLLIAGAIGAAILLPIGLAFAGPQTLYSVSARIDPMLGRPDQILAMLAMLGAGRVWRMLREGHLRAAFKIASIDIRSMDLPWCIALALLVSVAWLSMLIPAGSLLDLPGLDSGASLVPQACILPFAALFGWSWLRNSDPDPAFELVKRILWPACALVLAAMVAFAAATQRAAILDEVQNLFLVHLPGGVALLHPRLSNAGFLVLAGSALACAWVASAAGERDRAASKAEPENFQSAVAA